MADREQMRVATQSNFRAAALLSRYREDPQIDGTLSLRSDMATGRGGFLLWITRTGDTCTTDESGVTGSLG